VGSDYGLPAQFTPLKRASRGRRVLVLVVGPLLWLAAIVAVGLIVKHGRAVEIGLIATLIAFLLSLVVSVVARHLRLREEREAELS
jgi:membrane protein YdbS with pleckstrin-like domain